MNRREQIQIVVFGVSALAYFPFSEWISTTSIGTYMFLWGQIIFLLPLIFSVFALPVLLVCLIPKSTRRVALRYLLVAVLFVSCCMGGILLGSKTRMAGMQNFAQRSEKLIAAIKKYEQDNSDPPESLNDLVPNYLPSIPSTGMMAYPQYEYHSGPEARERYADNPWAISVFTPSGGINFDVMLFFPKQNYPTRGFGGSLERIAEWAYVHE